MEKGFANKAQQIAWEMFSEGLFSGDPSLMREFMAAEREREAKKAKVQEISR